MTRPFDYGPGGGVDFYLFGEVGSLPRLKNRHRARLDALPLNDADQQRLIRETKLVYLLNTEVLSELGRVVPAELAA